MVADECSTQLVRFVPGGRYSYSSVMLTWKVCIILSQGIGEFVKKKETTREQYVDLTKLSSEETWPKK